jgi:HlyD family secretion protein
MPDKEAKVAPLAAGRIKRVFVKTGDQVSKGQVIATLDPGPLLGQIQQAQAAIKTSQATIAQAQLNQRAQVATQQSSVTQARQNLQAQQIALNKLRAGSRPEEIAQARSALTAAQATLSSAQQNLSRSQTLLSEGLLARKDLEAAQTAEQTARTQVASAEAALNLALKGNRPQDVQAGVVAVEQAREQLRAAERQSLQNASKAQDVKIAQAQLQSAIGTLNSAKAQLASLTIRAPVSGTVVGRTVNAGESIDVTGAIATIVDLAQVRVLLNVPVAQLAPIKIGQLIEFTTESEPNTTHHATVTVINRAVDPATNTVQVEAAADNRDRKLRDDGFVKAQIIIQNIASALVVPVAAVVDKDGKKTVFTLDKENIAHAKEVKVGIQQGNDVQIVSGLGPGEKVVATGAFEVDDGTKVDTGEGASKGE